MNAFSSPGRSHNSPRPPSLPVAADAVVLGELANARRRHISDLPLVCLSRKSVVVLMHGRLPTRSLVAAKNASQATKSEKLVAPRVTAMRSFIWGGLSAGSARALGRAHPLPTGPCRDSAFLTRRKDHV